MHPLGNFMHASSLLCFFLFDPSLLLLLLFNELQGASLCLSTVQRSAQVMLAVVGRKVTMAK